MIGLYFKRVETDFASLPSKDASPDLMRYAASIAAEDEPKLYSEADFRKAYGGYIRAKLL